MTFGNIHNNFLVPRMNESAPKTFMPIQTSDLHCKGLQGITGTLQKNWSAGILNLWKLHVYQQSL